MSDGTAAQHGNRVAGHPDQIAMRASRLQHLEELLGRIAHHLQSTGNRHGDVVAQLQDRLRYLDQSMAAGTATPDLDRHLALFDAQLTSLAIRTGVSTPAPAPGPAPVVAAAPHPVASPQQQAFGAVPSAPVPPVAARATYLAPGNLPEPQGLPTPHDETAFSRSAEKPIGAPPPSQPQLDRPDLGALTRQSDLTFEDAVAADRAEQARASAMAAGESADDRIFAYHPSVAASPDFEAQADFHSPFVPVENVNTSEVPQGELDTADPEQSIANDFAPLHQASENLNSLSKEQEIFSKDIVQDDDLSIGSLRSELEQVLSGKAKTAESSVQEPVVYKDTPDATGMVAAIPEKNEDLSAQHSTDDGLDFKSEIERLTRQLDSVTNSVERIESGLDQTRTEIPSLIEQAAKAAAAQAAEQFKSADTQVNRRIDELHDLLDDRLTPDSRRAPIVVPAPVAASQSPLPTVEPQENVVAHEGRMKQAKQSVLQRLAPVGNALARRGKRAEAPIEQQEMQEQVVETPLPETGFTEAVQHAPLSPAADNRQHPAAQSGYLDEQEDLSSQSISNLRRSLFQNLKDGSPAALVLVFGIATILSGLLLWNAISGDGNDRLTQTALVDRTTTRGTDVTALPSDVTHSTKPMSSETANAVRTAGVVKPMSGVNNPLEGFPDLENTGPPVEKAALTPDPQDLSGNRTVSGGSKLELPPLATGPLSLRMAAASGDTAAQFEVASRLAQGNGVPRDTVAAVKWYTRAASAGHARAQYRLAALYERGVGVATDTGRAKIWYTRAAQQGNVKAMHNLAVLYAGQAAGSPNYVNAAQWFERAAEIESSW